AFSRRNWQTRAGHDVPAAPAEVVACLGLREVAAGESAGVSPPGCDIQGEDGAATRDRQDDRTTVRSERGVADPAGWQGLPDRLSGRDVDEAGLRCDICRGEESTVGAERHAHDGRGVRRHPGSPWRQGPAVSELDAAVDTGRGGATAIATECRELALSME